MDIRTGKTYATVEEARAAGVPESDIAKIIKHDPDSYPEVRFSSGPFKNRVYQRTKTGLVRVDK